MSENPYTNLPPEAYWRTGVADLHPLEMQGLWKPKFPIPRNAPIATAGSCFAQHISKAMQARGYNWLDSEPAPPILSEKLRKAYNYGIFTFRTGNIYSAALLDQWVRWALGHEEPPDLVFEDDGRFFDPFRPAIQPGGFDSRAAVLKARADTLQAMAKALTEMKVLVFTLGLTEGWVDGKSGHVYPVCPGTIAGAFEPDRHEFRNWNFPDIMRSLTHAFDAIRVANPGARFLLTVSPVPLTATASGKHVLVATTYSKSVLRAVAGSISQSRKDTDYFPSYEIIAGAPYRAMFYDPNLRTVTPKGVEHVMSHFFGAFGADAAAAPPKPAVGKDRTSAVEQTADDVVCEEALMEQWNAN
jgi:hypothetical protein